MNSTIKACDNFLQTIPNFKIAADIVIGNINSKVK
jgi:hypothetical protein